jgi:hypothetical protein
LGADLDALGLIGPFRDVRPLAFLGVDGSDGAVLALYQIHLGDDAESLGAEHHRARGEVGLLLYIFRLRHPAAPGVDARMGATALLGVAGVRPFPIDPFEKRKAGAINVFVDHAHRHERRLAVGRRGGKLEGELCLRKGSGLGQRGLWEGHTLRTLDRRRISFHYNH